MEASNGAASDDDSNEITDWPPFRKVHITNFEAFLCT